MRKGSHLTEENKKKISLAKRGKYCSSNTKFKKGLLPHNAGKNWSEEVRKKISMTLRGIKEQDWSGFADRRERTRHMDTTQYVDWRKTTLRRDNYTCQICGQIGGELRANHIRKYADYPNLRINPNNGITICESCDYKLVIGKEEQWESYFNFNLMARRFI